MDASAASLGYKPGDTVLVEFEDGKRRELKLAGYIHDVTGDPFSFTKMMNAYVTPKTMEWLGGSPNFDMLMVSVAENPTDQKHVTEVAQAVADRLERAGAEVYFVFVYQPGRHYAWRMDTSHLLYTGYSRLPDRDLERIPGDQYHHSADDPADTPDRHDESDRRQNIANGVHVRGLDPGIWIGSVGDRGSPGKRGGKIYRQPGWQHS